MKFRKVIESGIITAALALTSVTTAVSASAAEVDTTGVVGSVLDRASQIASTGIQSVQITHQNAQAAAAAAAKHQCPPMFSHHSSLLSPPGARSSRSADGTLVRRSCCRAWYLPARKADTVPPYRKAAR